MKIDSDETYSQQIYTYLLITIKKTILINIHDSNYSNRHKTQIRDYRKAFRSIKHDEKSHLTGPNSTSYKTDSCLAFFSPFSYIFFSSFTYLIDPTGLSLYIFSGFPAIFSTSSNNQLNCIAERV